MIQEKSVNKIKNASVVVSCFNQEKYIEDCILSIVNQKTDFQFEVIVTDDNSSDKTLEIVERVQKKFPRIISILKNSTNAGADENYIRGHLKAKGDVIFHFDGDDIMLPGKLQKQFDVFRKYPNVNVCFHRARYFNDMRDYEAETSFIFKNSNRPIEFLSLADMASYGTVAVHSSYAFRKGSRKLSIRRRPFMEWFWVIDALKDNDCKAAYLDSILVDYRCNQGSGAYSRNRKSRLRAYDIYFDDLLFYFNSIELRKELYANAFISVLGMIRYNRYFNSRYLKFILSNLRYLNFKRVLTVAEVRKSIAPKIRRM